MTEKDKELMLAKRLKTRELRAATAQGVITAELAARGFKYTTEYQAYRAKVSVLCQNHTYISFIIRYREIFDGSFDGIMERMCDLIAHLNENQDRFITVHHKRNCENWNCWK